VSESYDEGDGDPLARMQTSDSSAEAWQKMMPKQERPGPFQLVLVALSVYVLIALLLERTAPLSLGTRQILQWSDTAICVLFLYDFFARLITAPSKLKFLKWGWIDFVSSIPMLDIFRWGRLIRVARVLRVLRGIRSTKVILRFLFISRIKGALASAAFAAGVLLVFASVSILHCETDPTSTIRTPSDAVWWAVSTMTSVNFTDKFPVTEEGRMLGLLLGTCQ
jgi:voltage-gated potassium channel